MTTSTNEEVKQLKRTIEILESKLLNITLTIEEALKEQSVHRQRNSSVDEIILDHDNELDECGICCFVKSKNIQFEPCGHECCKSCSKKLKCCHICRQKITKRKKINQ